MIKETNRYLKIDITILKREEKAASYVKLQGCTRLCEYGVGKLLSPVCSMKTKCKFSPNSTQPEKLILMQPCKILFFTSFISPTQDVDAGTRGQSDDSPFRQVAPPTVQLKPSEGCKRRVKGTGSVAD